MAKLVAMLTNELFLKKECFECWEAKHFKDDCPRKKEAARPNVPPKPKARVYHMILDAIEHEKGDT